METQTRTIGQRLAETAEALIAAGQRLERQVTDQLACCRAQETQMRWAMNPDLICMECGHEVSAHTLDDNPEYHFCPLSRQAGCSIHDDCLDVCCGTDVWIRRCPDCLLEDSFGFTEDLVDFADGIEFLKGLEDETTDGRIYETLVPRG